VPSDWGDPLGYSITVNRKGESLETEYSVVLSPAKDEAIALRAKIEALFVEWI
jgi:hypothetical protein